MVTIGFAATSDIAEQLKDRGFTVQLSLHDRCVGHVEVPDAVKADVFKLLRDLGVVPWIEESSTLIPPCVSDEDVDKLIVWVARMGFGVRRDDDRVVGDAGGISKISVRFSDIVVSKQSGATISVVGA